MERTALITGVRRVGRFVAEGLLRRGYNLAVVYRSSEEVVGEIRNTADSLGRKFVAVRADLSRGVRYGELVDRVVSELGGIDAFVHLASPYRRSPLETLTPEDLDYHMGPIAEAFLFLSLEVYRVMLRNEGTVKGRIVAFGDWAVETPYRGYTAYFIAKGALHTAVKVLAKEFAPHVLVNCVALGPTLKPEDLEEGIWHRVIKNTPLKREVPLEDVVNLVIFLLEAEGITGEIIRLDSGRHIAGSGTGSLV
ncbi:MAG: SDR family oxidoreductase [Aquificota bacterium]|nr:SDR family oxidoreductase [Aquificota bacterium]